jgi:2-polyprenyl-6-methoxyphenol hydroxylase-like FAD-dependent oxidoreductase
MISRCPQHHASTDPGASDARRLLPAGGAAHKVPPTDGGGLNLGVSDVSWYLTTLLHDSRRRVISTNAQEYGLEYLSSSRHAYIVLAQQSAGVLTNLHDSFASRIEPVGATR